ncbi:DUF6124 family protein [Pseudomonas sp. R5(2019)]|uniref:DUF6124 family protein n=1 Tax=Pseudomonas sp. R5(2019) TaxID=2697566 RepID=UPI0014128403|nr:DUF3077 domain-containing protein [Pseudomonas sp. R5(2019)]NBA95973.1 DUF3077 domain-containing protein [Pseudomonas sp. R5(2019)]
MNSKPRGVQASDLDNTPTLSESEAARRALDYYLNPEPVNPQPERPPFMARDGLSTEQALTHALMLMRCTAATAYEVADAQQGSKRDLAFSVVHMADMTKTLVERALDQYQRQ